MVGLGGDGYGHKRRLSPTRTFSPGRVSTGDNIVVVADAREIPVNVPRRCLPVGVFRAIFNVPFCRRTKRNPAVFRRLLLRIRISSQKWPPS